MKRYFFLIILLSFVFIFQNCSSQNQNAQNSGNIQLDTKNFVFHAQRANPMSYDAVNMVNSLPGGAPNRILDLNSDNYTFSVKDNVLESVLPYIGTRYNATFGNTDQNSYRFTSKSFTISESKGKRSKTIWKIQVKDVSYISDVYLEMYPDGKAYLSIKGNDRQPISYDGYMSINEK